ncbi:MAG: response regulator transcription factor [Actinomycetota bacterium]|nr:response regulator transcription factor [Actinomycetota bacterium]
MRAWQAEEKNARVRLLIAAEQPGDSGLRMVALDPGVVEVVTVVQNQEELLACAGQGHVDVVLIELELPPLGSIHAGRMLLAIRPGIKVMVLADGQRGDVARKAMEAGLHGCLRPPVGSQTLTSALGCVLDGLAVVSHDLAGAAVGARSAEEREAAQRARSLTVREREILGLLVEGLRSGDIAAQLFLSRHTVRTHLYNLFGKLGVHSRAEAIRFAVRYEVVEKPEERLSEENQLSEAEVSIMGPR